jgi:hypothetical protein
MADATGTGGFHDLSHVGEAIRGKARWVFLTDDPDGHVAFVGVVLRLVRRGADANTFGVGLGKVIDPAGGSTVLSFLTVPKGGVAGGEIERMLRAEGCRHVPRVGARDIVLLTRHSERLALICQGLSDGAYRPAGDPADN